jgi:hypothetical protein
MVYSRESKSVEKKGILRVGQKGHRKVVLLDDYLAESMEQNSVEQLDIRWADYLVQRLVN